MRRSPAATSRTGRPGAASVSLFPFLAVLICTMGALILLLVVIARQARLQAAQATRAAAAESFPQKQEVEAERELVRWRISQIKASRGQMQSQLADARLKLGQIEDHTRQLQDKLVRLQAAWAELQSLARDGPGRQEGLDQELAGLKRQVAQAKQQLADAEKAAAERRPSYAVVPYEGPHATRRQPIYIECRADAIVLQPEGIELGEADFIGPLGPGNPLDVALRARREYLLDHGRLDPETSGEAYPLLLVRPAGIEAFYVARAAMESWASDFGYELIGEDWKLEFPPADPVLADEITRAVNVARARQARLAQAVPGFGGALQRPKYRAAPYLGGAVLDGRSGRDSGSGLPWGLAGGRPFGGRDAEVSRPAGGSSGGRSGGASGSAAERFGGGYARASETSAAPAAPTPGAVAGRPPREQDRPNGAAGAAPRPGQWTPKPESSETADHAGTEAAASGRPLAETRGGGWGLPDAAHGSVPITRPIRVDCYPDRLILVPERGVADVTAIRLEASTADGVDAFISAVWELMDRWGIAGQGMYWRPVLNVRVAEGAEGRFADLQTLLDGSGLDVRRKAGP